MNIFIIGKQNFLYWDSHVVDAFKELNHNVEHFQINNRPFSIQFIRGITKGLLGKQKGSEISNKLLIKNLKNRLELFKADLIFFTSACFIPLEFYQTVNELSYKPKIFAWEGDGGANNDKNKNIVPYIDILFETNKMFVQENKHNFKNIIHLPFCSNTKLYNNLNHLRENKSYFCGAWLKERDEIFSQLTDYDIVLRGWNWDKLSSKSEKFDIKLGTVDIKDQINDYNRYKSVINKHQYANNHLVALNMRTFEVPSCKTLLINDYREGLENMFDIGQEILVYKNVEELKVIFEKMKKNPNEFDKIIENGYKRVFAEHTYVHRMQEVLSYL